MSEQFARTQLLLGEEAMKRLERARVAVFGIGGVGGHVCEALVRSGVGAFDLIDDDKVCLSNLNRQIIATHETIGRYKVDVMKERMLSINPDVKVRVYPCFFLPENADRFPFEEYDYIVDAIDTVTAKLEIITRAKALHIPVISAMGAGNKLDPCGFRVCDIYETSMDPLAKVMRRELKKRNVQSLKVVFSKEQPAALKGEAEVTGAFAAGLTQEEQPEASMGQQAAGVEGQPHRRRATPGSTSFVPAVCGLILAGEVIKDLSQA